MNQAEYVKYLKSTRWKALSRRAKQRAGWRCQLCNSKGRLNAHHRSYERVGTDKEIYDLIVLCERCHLLAHLGHLHTEQALIVNRVGTLLINRYRNVDSAFEQYLLRKCLRYLGVLYYLNEDNISTPLILDLQEYYSGDVIRFVETYLFGTDKQVKHFAGDREQIMTTLRTFLDTVTQQCRNDFTHRRNLDEDY